VFVVVIKAMTVYRLDIIGLRVDSGMFCDVSLYVQLESPTCNCASCWLLSSMTAYWQWTIWYQKS